MVLCSGDGSNVFFLCLKTGGRITPVKPGVIMFSEVLDEQKRKTEVEVVRTKITLACTECKRRNYNMTKDKKTHPDRMETKKYCRFCKSHTMHKETK